MESHSSLQLRLLMVGRSSLARFEISRTRELKNSRIQEWCETFFFSGFLSSRVLEFSSTRVLESGACYPPMRTSPRSEAIAMASVRPIAFSFLKTTFK